MGVTLHTSLAKTADLAAGQFVEEIEGYTVLSDSVSIATPVQIFLKRCLDIAGGIVGCLITGILFLVMGPAIYVKSPGPVFFRQERVGKNGRRFYMYKFRSMYMDAEERKQEFMEKNNIKDGRMFKLHNDPRIIKGVGKFIREYSIDEFPQFWNVLKGDMSLVGTRPPTVDEWEKYEAKHRGRLAIRPGITGMWQVHGRSDITDFNEVVRLDKEYIARWSIGLDFKILFQTIGVVLKRKARAKEISEKGESRKSGAGCVMRNKSDKLNIAMLGQKRIPSREGGIEIVVEELSTRMVQTGHSVTCYNRLGHLISGKEFDGDSPEEYKGIKLREVFTIQRRGFAAVTSSLSGAIHAAAGRYDVVHFHAEGSCVMLWLPRLLGKRCIVTVHGLDWQRAKWKGFARRYIKFGEKMAVKYADEIIVLSESARRYFWNTYGRKTVFIPNGVNRPAVRAAER